MILRQQSFQAAVLMSRIRHISIGLRYIVARPASATIPVAPASGNSITVAVTQMSPPTVFRCRDGQNNQAPNEDKEEKT